MKLRITKTIALALCCGFAASAAGCGVGPDKSREDAHDTQNVDKSAPHATAFNNHYPNVQDKCDGHGHRIFVTTSKATIIIADPSCPGWTQDTPAAAAVGKFGEAAQ